MYQDDGDNDSYHEATEGQGLSDDNRTATGTVKSYRKTPFNSRYTSKASNINTGGGGVTSPATIYNIDPKDAPADEHRLLLHDLFARYVTDPANGLTIPQARANLELYGPNEIVSALEVPGWVRFCKSLFGGSSILLWIGLLLCFTNYSLEVGMHESPPLENVFLGLALLIVIFITGILAFIQESRSVSLEKQFEKQIPKVARVIREGEEIEVSEENNCNQL